MGAKVAGLQRLSARHAVGKDLLDHPALPTGAYPGLRPQVGIGGHSEQAMKQTTIAQIDARGFDQTLAQVRRVGGQVPHHERTLQIVQVRLNRVVRKTHTLPELAGVQNGPLLGRQHAQQSFDDGRPGRQSPVGKVALGHQPQVAFVPGRVGRTSQHAPIWETAHAPKSIRAGGI